MIVIVTAESTYWLQSHYCNYAAGALYSRRKFMRARQPAAAWCHVV